MPSHAPSQAPGDGVVQELNALRHASTRARMKALLPLIDDLVCQGVAHNDILATLANAGLVMKPASLRQALCRWRKRQPRAPIRNPQPASVVPSTPTRAPPTANEPAVITSKADLVRLRQSQHAIDLNQLAELGRKK